MGQAHAANNTGLKVSGASVSFTDQPMTLISGTSGKTWQISSLAKDLWDPTQSVTIKSNGSAVSASNYTINYLFGSVTFDTNRSGETITATGNNYPHYYVPMARVASWQDSRNAIDASVFFDDGPRVILGQRQLEVTGEHIDIETLPLDGSGGSEKTLKEIFHNGGQLVVEYGPEGTADGTKTGARQGLVHRAWVKITESQLSLTLGEAVTTELQFELNSVNSVQSGRSVSHVATFNY